MKRRSHWILGIHVVVSASIILFFQNCGEFSAIGTSSQLSSIPGADGSGAGSGSLDPSDPPLIEFLAQPKALSNSTETEIEFQIDTGQQSLANIECFHNLEQISPCQSPILLEELDEGTHRFSVRAVDSSGQESTEDAGWIVDLTPAAVAISAGPPLRIRDSVAEISFNVADGTDDVAALLCSFNEVEPSECQSPVRLENLGLGNYQFEVTAVDEAGNEQSDAIAWTVAPPENTNAQGTFIFDPRTFRLINANTGIVVDDDDNAIYLVNMQTGVRTLLSSEARGTGPVFARPQSIVVNSVGTRAYLLASPNPGNEVIYEIDLATGNRTVVFDDGGGALREPKGLEISADDARLYTVHRVVVNVGNLNGVESNRIRVINIANGGISNLPGFTVQANQLGIVYLSNDIAFNADKTFAYVLYYDVLGAQDPATLVRVNLANGSTTNIFSNQNGFGRANVVIGPNETYAYLGFFSSVYRVNLANGVINLVSGQGIGMGPSMSLARDLTISPLNDYLYAPDERRDGVIRINIANGNREFITDSNYGQGDRLSLFSSDLHASADGTSFYALDSPRLLKVDIASGNRTVLSSNEVGVGPGLGSGGMHINAAETTAYVATSILPTSIVKVDLATGNRTEVSGPNAGAGEAFGFLRAIAVNAAETIAYVGDDTNNSIVRVDLLTGNRTTISSAVIGAGEPFDRLSDFVLNAAEDQLFTVDSRDRTLKRVDIATGNRTLIAGRDNSRNLNWSGIALSPAGTHAYISDDANRMISRFSLADGTETIITSSDVGSGFRSGNYTGITIDPTGTYAIVAMDDQPSFVEVNLTTGKRVVISR